MLTHLSYKSRKKCPCGCVNSSLATKVDFSNCFMRKPQRCDGECWRQITTALLGFFPSVTQSTHDNLWLLLRTFSFLFFCGLPFSSSIPRLSSPPPAASSSCAICSNLTLLPSRGNREEHSYMNIKRGEITYSLLFIIKLISVKLIDWWPSS